VIGLEATYPERIAGTGSLQSRLVYCYFAVVSVGFVLRR
jgi:hypothetical protein